MDLLFHKLYEIYKSANHCHDENIGKWILLLRAALKNLRVRPAGDREFLYVFFFSYVNWFDFPAWSKFLLFVSWVAGCCFYAEVTFSSIWFLFIFLQLSNSAICVQQCKRLLLGTSPQQVHAIFQFSENDFNVWSDSIHSASSSSSDFNSTGIL